MMAERGRKGERMQGVQGQERLKEGETLLCVDVIGARNLPSLTQALEGGRAPRLYLVIKHGKQRACTALVKATKQPKWDQKFVFKLNTNQKKNKSAKEHSPDALNHTSHRDQKDPNIVESDTTNNVVASAVKPSKKKDHLFFSMFTCDAHNDVVEAALTQRIRGDGPSLTRMQKDKENQQDGQGGSRATASTLFPSSSSSLDRNNVLDLSTTGASIPMPIRQIGKTVVLLHGPDAAPLQKMKTNTDNDRDSHLLIEWLDIIPTHGGGIHGRSSNIPLFTFGQLGVKIYVQEEGGGGGGVESECISTSESEQQQQPSNVVEQEEKCLGKSIDGAMEKAQHKNQDTTDTSSSSSDKHEEEKEVTPEAKEEEKGKGKEDHSCPVIKKKWQPPSSVDWTAIGATLVRECVHSTAMQGIVKEGEGEGGLLVKLPRNVAAGFKEILALDPTTGVGKNTHTRARVPKDKGKLRKAHKMNMGIRRVLSVAVVGVLLLVGYCCIYQHQLSIYMTHKVSAMAKGLHEKSLLVVPVATGHLARFILTSWSASWFVFYEHVIKGMALSNLTDYCQSESHHYFFPTFGLM
jgi:hypothetical protein